MREIKFRAWDKNKNKLVHEGDACGFVKNKVTTGDLLDWFEDEDLMQYTGLKDKNGKEIYEGDIVIPTVIEDDNISFWRGSNPKFEPIPQEIKWRNYGFELPTWDTKMGSWEVIGNIYENGDLLQLKAVQPKEKKRRRRMKKWNQK